MVGAVRLYVEARRDIPDHRRPLEHIPVIDVSPEEAGGLLKRLRRKGYEVHAFAI